MSSSDNSDSGNERYPISNGDLFRKKNEAKKKKKIDEKIDESDQKKKVKGKKTDPKTKLAKEWTDEDTSLLIDQLESKPGLWDVYHAEYSKRDIKEIAYSEMALAFDTNISSIKKKLSSLRTRFGSKLTKERSTKSGQSTDELYRSNWTFYSQLVFLTPVFGTSKSRDTLKRMNTDKEDEDEKEVAPNKSRKTFAEKKLDLLSQCTAAITANAKSSPPQAK